MNKPNRKWKEYIRKPLPYDEGERCPALDTMGYQCEGCQGHKEQHWRRWSIKKSKHAYGWFT